MTTESQDLGLMSHLKDVKETKEIKEILNGIWELSDPPLRVTFTSNTQ